MRGCTWGILTSTPGGVSDAAKQLNQLARDGKLRPIVGATYARQDAAAALTALRERTAHGKSVMQIS